MEIVDVGHGTPVVMVPGIQGRWEWMRPAVEALARRCRVITFSLADEPTCRGRFDPAHGFDDYVAQVCEAMAIARLDRAAVCGVSYGGLVAASPSARHPDRVSSLVLVSALPPSWEPDERVRFYLRAPRLLSPLFCVSSLRLYNEIAAAAPGVVEGMRTALRSGWTALTHPFSPARMARRVRLLEALDLTAELRAVRVPALVMTGEACLDRVVPVARTREYLTLWPHATGIQLDATGHLGSITRPDVFAAHVAAFVAQAHEIDQRRRIG